MPVTRAVHVGAAVLAVHILFFLLTMAGIEVEEQLPLWSAITAVVVLGMPLRSLARAVGVSTVAVVASSLIAFVGCKAARAAGGGAVALLASRCAELVGALVFMLAVRMPEGIIPVAVNVLVLDFFSCDGTTALLRLAAAAVGTVTALAVAAVPIPHL